MATMKIDTLQWEKVASVRPGGKPYFFVAFPTLAGHQRKFCVSWRRFAQCWIASFDDLETCLVPEEILATKDLKDAKHACEEYYAQALALAEAKE